MLFAAAARIVEFVVGVIADLRKKSCVEEGAIVGELRQLIPVAESPCDVRDRECEGEDFAGRERLVERIDGIEIARRAAHQVERAVELDVRDRLLLIRDVDLRDGLRRLVLQREAARTVEGAATWVDVDRGFDRSDLRLRQQFVLLEVSLVSSPDVAAVLGGKVLVKNVSVVEVPRAGTNGDQQKQGSGGHKTRRAAKCKAAAGAKRVFRTATCVSDGDDAEEGEDAEPVGNRPEERRDKMSIAIHVRVGVWGSGARKV